MGRWYLFSFHFSIATADFFLFSFLLVYMLHVHACIYICIILPCLSSMGSHVTTSLHEKDLTLTEEETLSMRAALVSSEY